MIGRVLGRYKILEEVGQGGMAVVYRGLDTALGREVAVKVLHPHLAGQPESRARLEREAQAVAKLRHENILEIFDYAGPDSTDRFLVTEFIHGPTLTEFFREQQVEGVRPPRRFEGPAASPSFGGAPAVGPQLLPEVAAMIASEVARALEHAHALGVIHRDVKPENVMIRPNGTLVLTDFGIAQIVDKERMTVTGQLLGSPAYMAPEHVEGTRIDFRTDVFACGILAYQLATGVLPFRGKNPHEVLKKIAECRFVPPEQENPLVSPALSRIICKALAKDPDARHPDAATLRRELCAELGSSAIADPRAELARFFSDPAGWERVFRPRLVAALADGGRKALASGRTAAALSAWSRALSLEPGNGEVRALVEALGQRRLRRTIAAAVGGLAALAALGMIWFRLLAHTSGSPDAGHPPGALVEVPPPPSSSGTRAGDPMARAGAAPSGLEASRFGGLGPRGRNDVRRQLLNRPVPLASRKVTLNVFQKNVDIFVDGAPRGTYDGSAIEVGPGPHQILLRSPSCSDRLVDIGPDEVSTPQIKLPWKNGRLIVETTPEDAELSWSTERNAERNPGQGGQELRVRFPPEHDRADMNVAIDASASGFRSAHKVCVARAGAETHCHLDLDRVN